MKDKYTGKNIVIPLDTLNESEPEVGVQPNVRFPMDAKPCIRPDEIHERMNFIKDKKIFHIVYKDGHEVKLFGHGHHQGLDKNVVVINGFIPAIMPLFQYIGDLERELSELKELPFNQAEKVF